jgi:hypothetical protein
MSEQHKPDPEFVEYLKKEVNNPFLSAATVLRMEQVFIWQRAKYEAILAARAQGGQFEETCLPPFDPNKPRDEQGLYGKFLVRRVDGSDLPGGKHHGCKYFVLDVDHDKYAAAALGTYASQCEQEYPLLAKDLREKFGAQGGQGAEPVAEIVHDYNGISVQWLEPAKYGRFQSGQKLYIQPQPAVPEETEAMVDAAVKVFEDAGARVDLGWLGEACRAYVAASFTPTTPQADGCPECGSTDLSWHTQSSVTNGTPDGKLRANEVSTLFVLGCGHCSETIKTLTADQVAENMSPQPPAGQEGAQ